MEREILPKHCIASRTKPEYVKQKSRKILFPLILGFVALCASYNFGYLYWATITPSSRVVNVPFDAQHITSRCDEIRRMPGVSETFHRRKQSDRFVIGTQPVLIRNATIWTGRSSGSKTVNNGAILLDNGLIKWLGDDLHANEAVIQLAGSDVVVINAEGSWVTPGIVDVHSHAGVGAIPELSGAADTNSPKGIVQPFLRTLDAINTHDEAYALMTAGGITSANILPGSAGAIGGQAFPIKPRPTKERSSSSMLIEQFNSSQSTGWRHMKHACGENPSRFYSGTRMDTIWAFREIYNEAKQLVQQQDKVCAAVKDRNWNEARVFPENLKLEALTDILRGKVKVHTHCYEAVDLDAFIRLSNEFQFPIAVFHHAAETYLVPDLLKKAYGGPPASALFATFARYKREAYRGSEFAPRILHKNGLRVIMKSDHPSPINARYLIFEAQQAFFYGLPADAALESVTTIPADVLGLGHRIGTIDEGYDADIVIWDSHPLALGATPKQVYIDGIPQLTQSFLSTKKPDSFNEIPRTPNFDDEAANTVIYEGLPPLTPSKEAKDLVFKNVKSVWLYDDSDIGISHITLASTFDSELVEMNGTDVVVQNGQIVHVGSISNINAYSDYETVDLMGGSIAPSFTTFGSPLGLSDIVLESSTTDGTIRDPLTEDIPSILQEDATIIRAVDGLQFGSRDALLAYRSGVTVGVVAPQSSGVFSGLSAVFSTGSSNKLRPGAVIKDVAAVHVSISRGGGDSSSRPSISTQITALRRVLLGNGKGEEQTVFNRVIRGELPLIVNADNADVIATLITLKKEVEDNGGQLRLTISGAAEAHLLAFELGQADIGVILTPFRATPSNWDQKGALPGPPLTQGNAVGVLLANGVTVGLGGMPMWPWTARNLRLDIAWAAIMNPGITQAEALAMGSTNLEKLLGINIPTRLKDMVAYHGDIFDLSGKAVAVISPGRQLVDLL